jgi:membrane protein implicated in regulation of membrane protease activity
VTLRNVLLVIALVALGLGALAVAMGVASLWVLIVWAAILALALAVERFRYKALQTGSPGPGWQRTSERFVDDETGKIVTVWLDPRTGERQYVKD